MKWKPILIFTGFALASAAVISKMRSDAAQLDTDPDPGALPPVVVGGGIVAAFVLVLIAL